MNPTAEKAKLDDMKSRLQEKAMQRHMLSMLEGDKTLVDGLQKVPVKVIMDQIQYMENVMLPKIKANRGESSEEYKYYSSLCDSLQWAIVILDRYESMRGRLYSLRMMTALQEERITLAYRELSKYEAAEDLMMMDAMDHYLAAAAKRVQEKLTKK